MSIYPETYLPAANDLSSAVGIIASRKYDYFEDTIQAHKHAKAEQIDPSYIEENIGFEESYTRIPRVVDKNLLSANIDQAFLLLHSDEPVDFLFVDRNVEVRGKSDPNENVPILHFPNNGRIVEIQFVPQNFVVNLRTQNAQTDLLDDEGRLSLILGRNILASNPYQDELDMAARDSERPWETIFAVGNEAIKAYRSAVSSRSA